MLNIEGESFLIKLFMFLKKVAPVNNSSRHKLRLTKNLLAKNNKFIKQIKKGQKNVSGRSPTTGHITTRHNGGGVKKNYRFINFSNREAVNMVVATIYDPNRSAFVSTNYDFLSKKFCNTLATHFVYPGSLLICSEKISELKLGYRTLLRNIPTGSIIHNISHSRTYGTLIRSAGTFGQIVQKNETSCKIKLPSGFIKDFPIKIYATLGVVSNLQNNLIVIGKAGTNRLRGHRPSVRGIAMNPVDHPHGGRTNGGMPSVTPWGKPNKGKPTVKHKK
jgi:large subunit ribosomal protein L2